MRYEISCRGQISYLITTVVEEKYTQLRINILKTDVCKKYWKSDVEY